ncbi:hypothetical protein ACS5PK_20515 [Roseateles sp. DB2]|uniref:hypothetical protein n=1 Tax=Roseateles sp. DB2 TaxID=3453717 RepID=UPI003EEE25D7
MAVLTVVASAASAGVDCTPVTPQLVVRDGVEGTHVASGPRQQALLGGDAGGASLLLPGVAVFSWEGANGPCGFFNAFVDQAEQDRKRLKDILDCFDGVAACPHRADAQPAGGELSDSSQSDRGAEGRGARP